jgi:hypothetical protein
MSTDLDATFDEAVKWFNRFQTGNWPNLDPLLHEAIRMKRIDDPDPTSYHEGKTAVQSYFFTKGKDDQAEFRPDDDRTLNIDGDYGIVSGQADFIDITNRLLGGPTPKRRIKYSIRFKRGDDPSDAGNWQAIVSWGEYLRVGK